jgi:hypothetical protein
MTNGLVVMTPSSIAYSGTSASINADGSVTFSATTSLSLNGVFTSDYDNYMVTIRATGTNDTYVRCRLRASGVDESSASNYYVDQYLYALSTTVAASRTTTNGAQSFYFSNAQRSGNTAYFFAPFLAQPTAVREVGAVGWQNATLQEFAWTHSLSNSYDGFTFYPNAGSLSGLLTVFGFNQ